MKKMRRNLKIGVSGVRGVVGETLSPALAADFAASFGGFTGRGVVIVGRDTRPSGVMMENAVAAGLLAAIALFLLLRGRDAPPDWVAWKEGALSASPWEIQLENQHISAVWNGEISWQPEEETLVQDALLCDINHDGAQELLLLTWRKERYGDSRPFWEEEEEAEIAFYSPQNAIAGNIQSPILMCLPDSFIPLNTSEIFLPPDGSFASSFCRSPHASEPLQV